MTRSDSWETVTGTLYGYGALPWPEVRQRLDGFDAMWGDVDGMHLADPLPAEAPAYTHLWAWRDGACARVRLDLPADRHILGLYVIAGDPPHGEPLVTDHPVAATVYPVRGWGNLDRVKRLAPEFRDPALERLVTRQTASLTFVRPAGKQP